MEESSHPNVEKIIAASTACPVHELNLLIVPDPEFQIYFGIKTRRCFACPVTLCDFVCFGPDIGESNIILSHERHLALTIFARQKAALYKTKLYAGQEPFRGHSASAREEPPLSSTPNYLLGRHPFEM